MSDAVYIVIEGQTPELRRSFAICDMQTQEPVNGFDNLIIEKQRAIEIARKLSTLETLCDVYKLASKARAESDANSTVSGPDSDLISDTAPVP